MGWGELLDIQIQPLQIVTQSRIVRSDDSRGWIVGARLAKLIEDIGYKQDLFLWQVRHQEIGGVPGSWTA